MKEYSIINIQGDFYIAYKEDNQRKNLTKKESLYAFNNLFLKDIIGLKKADNILVVTYKDITVRISDWSGFLEKFGNTQFVYNIEKFAEAHNLQATPRNKVTRKNKNTGKFIESVALAGAILTASFVANANFKNEQNSGTLETTTSYVEETTVPQSVTELEELTTQTTIATTEPTTQETTTETTTKETTTEATRVTGLSGYKYINNYAEGFVVTTGNKTYSISAEDFDLFCATVMSEGGENPNEALAVASVILNRCDSGWGGTTVREVIEEPGQFEVISEGYYLPYLNGKVPDTVKMAVTDALGGIRNCEYESFRSNKSVDYGGHILTQGGNRYKN